MFGSIRTGDWAIDTWTDTGTLSSYLMCTLGYSTAGLVCKVKERRKRRGARDMRTPHKMLQLGRRPQLQATYLQFEVSPAFDYSYTRPGMFLWADAVFGTLASILLRVCRRSMGPVGQRPDPNCDSISFKLSLST